MKTKLLLLLLLTLPYTLFASETSAVTQVVIVLGAPASGKGTQAIKLAKTMGIPHISTGDLFRDNISKNTELGQKAQEFTHAGKLVPDDLVLEMLFKRLSQSDASQGYVLDGFPRTIAQAEALEKKLPAHATVIVANLVVSDTTIVKRGLGRKRVDDTPEIIKERLKHYYAQTAPLIEYYTKKGLLKTIDGEKSPEVVFDELKDAILSSKKV